MRGLEAGVRQALDQRLKRDDTRPIAVGLSGGGDSVALTLIADEWAREAGRPLLILSVDHGLQPEARRWTKACADLAHTLGRPFRALTWIGDKPRTGLPAAARAARHRLMAAAAREAAASVLLLGHTGDDRLEAEAMRRAGSTTPDPQEWAPSPIWPEGRGLMLLRPMLDVRRADLRDWLAARGQSWIDDPANQDLRYARARARRGMVAGWLPARRTASPLMLAQQMTHRAGVLTIPRHTMQVANPDDTRRLLALACVCAGGGSRPPAGARVTRLAEAIRGPEFFTSTLAGARIEADEGAVRIFREPGELVRAGTPAMTLDAGRAVIWDGRFEVKAGGRGGSLTRLAGLMRRLPPDQQARLLDLPAAARGALPAILFADGAVTCPVLTGRARSLIPDRLAAAAGLVQREPEFDSYPST